MKLTKSAYVVLGLISKEPVSGYSLKQTIKKVSRFYWSESNAQIYPILKQLEAEKLVTSKIDKSSGDRQKRIFTITKTGMKVLKNWLTTFCEPTPYREELLLKISMGQHLSKTEIIDHLNSYKISLQSQLSEYLSVVNHIKMDCAKQPDQVYLLMLYDHIEEILNAKLTWCERHLKKFKKIKR